MNKNLLTVFKDHRLGVKDVVDGVLIEAPGVVMLYGRIPMLLDTVH